MEAKELRIGNYVDYEKTTHIISELNQNKCSSYWIKSVIEDNYLHRYDEINPIPLTEEWAVKFGYECLIEMAIDLSKKSKYDIEITSKELKEIYVHEAQNLFYALSGEELTFND